MKQVYTTGMESASGLELLHWHVMLPTRMIVVFFFFNMGTSNFQSIEEYKHAFKREVSARVDQYYESFSDKEKKILSKRKLYEKIVEIHKENRISKEYLSCILKGTDNARRTRSIHLDSFLANLFGKSCWSEE